MLKFLFLRSFLSSLEIKHSGIILVCVSVTLLEVLLNLKSLQSDFSRPFYSPVCSQGKKTFTHFVV